MDSQVWRARGHTVDYRRYTVAEGDAPLPLGSTRCRKLLRSAGQDNSEKSSSTSQLNPEDSQSGDLSNYGNPKEGEELQRLCQRCHIVTSQLKRQAAVLINSKALKDVSDTSFLFEKLWWPRHGCQSLVSNRCNICHTSFQQLRCLALCHTLGVCREATPTQLATCQGSEGSWGGDELPHKSQRWSYKEHQGIRTLWSWGGVKSTYLGGGGAKGLTTVTPLPLNTPHYLEGVWRVQQQSVGWTADEVCVTMQSSSPDVKQAGHSVATQTSQPPPAGAAFFTRVAQKLSLSRRRKSQPGSASYTSKAPGPLVHSGGFSGALQLSPPALPPCLLRAGSKVKDKSRMGKVRVMVRVCSDSLESGSFLKVDSRRKQLMLCRPSCGRSSWSSLATAAPRRHSSFRFDAIFTQDASQAEVCSAAVAGVIQALVNGADGCIFCFGHAHLGKTYTMIGRDSSMHSLGVAPTAVSWLFRVMEERQRKLGACFSITVSSVEISGREEVLTDLLAPLSCSSLGGQQGASGPRVLLREDPLCGSQLQNQTVLQATSAKQAAFFLDSALAARSNQVPGDQESPRNSHFLFTLHLYQERQDKNNKATMSGHLHLLDLGSCEMDLSSGQCLSLSALGNVILALTTGAKHVPYRDSKLTMLLSESLGNINCQTTMIAHISDSVASYTETLTMVQLASQIRRVRKKSKSTSSSSRGESSCEEGASHTQNLALNLDTAGLFTSDSHYSSTTERSCHAVVHIGPRGTEIPERELCNNEGLPIVPSLNKKWVKNALRCDRDHFKCNTFAELQERLDCIDSSEDSATFRTEAKSSALRTQTRATKSKSTSPHKCDSISSQGFLEGTKDRCTNELDQEKSRYPSASHPGEAACRNPPAEMSQQAPRKGQLVPTDVNQDPGALLGDLDGDFLRTIVTLQQPVELNGEDELVFMVIGELPHDRVPHNGQPSNTFSFQPVSIISSITDDYDTYTSQHVSHLGIKSSQNKNCAVPDSSHATQNKPHSPKASLKMKKNASVSAQSPCGAAHSSLSRKTMTATSATVECSCQRPEGKGNSIPQPPRVQVSPSAQPNSQQGDAPRLTRDDTTVGTLPTPHNSETNRNETISASCTPKFSSLRKNVQKNIMNPKMATIKRAAEEQKTVAIQSSSDFTEKLFLKTTSEVECKVRIQTDSCGLETSSLKTEHGCAKTSFSLKMRGVKGHSSRYDASLRSWETNSEAAGSNSELTRENSGSSNRTNRSASKLAAPTSTSASLYQYSPGILVPAIKAVGEVKGSSSPKTVAGVSKVRALLIRGSKSLSSSCKALDEQKSSLSQTGKLPAVSIRGGKNGRDAIFGMKQILSEVTNNEVSEPAAASRRTRVSKEPGTKSNEGTHRRIRSFRGSPISTLLQSPYSKITAPRRRYSSGHSTSNSSGHGTSNSSGHGTSNSSGHGTSNSSGHGTSNSSVHGTKKSSGHGTKKSSGHGTSNSSGHGTSNSSGHGTSNSSGHGTSNSSGHGTSNSSVLIVEPPPAVGHTALLYHSDCSSGYESMIQDSGTTGSTTNEGGMFSSNRCTASKLPWKRGNAIQRHRLLPVLPLGDTSRFRRLGGQWADLPPFTTGLKKPFAIKVYEIDDVRRIRRGGLTGAELFNDFEKGLLYVNARLMMLGKRQQLVRNLRRKHDQLQEELQEAKNQLMLDATKWSCDFDVDQDLDQDSQDYLEALSQATVELEFCVNLCKSRIMMETCFDITVKAVTSSTPGGWQQAEQ